MSDTGRIIRLAVAVATVVATFAIVGQAGASKARTARGEYNTVSCCDADRLSRQRISNGVTFDVRPGERFVTVVVEDAHADHVLAVVGQDVDGDGVEDERSRICDSSTDPIRVDPAHDLTVWTQVGTCEDGTLSNPTFGKVTATFTR